MLRDWRLISNEPREQDRMSAYVFLLLVYVSNLKPNIRMGEGAWRVTKDAIEASKWLVILSLLFVDYAESKKDLISFIKI